MNKDFLGHPKTIFEIIKRHAEATPEAVAIAAPGRRHLSYQQLMELINGTRQFIHKIGVGRNDRIAIVLPNGPEMATAFLSIASATTAAPLNPDNREEGFRSYLLDLDVQALVVIKNSDSPAIHSAKSLSIPVISLAPSFQEAAGCYSLHCDLQRPAMNDHFADMDDVALVLHTSGTTSRPKIVPLTHSNLCSSACNIGDSLHLESRDRCLNVMPLFHIHGLVGALLSSMTAGASVACSPGFLAPRFFDWMEECQPTWYTAVPTMHQAILARAPAHAAIISRRRLRFIRSCSSSLPPRVISELESIFSVPVIEAYGMTEASHQMSANPLPPGKQKPGSVGLPTGTDIALMDDSGSLLSQSVVGEIVIRGPGVTKGYDRNPEANAKSFTNGWFRTGDQGYLDQDGYLFITGRIKEIINRGGEKISPREVEEALLDHTDVIQAVCFALPDSRLGEDVGAAVVLRPGTKAEQKEIRHFVAQRLPNFKVPSIIVFLDDLPKGPTGKPQRINLVEKLGLHDQNRSVVPDDLKCTPPKTAIEKALVSIWQEVLRLERVGTTDRYSDLGGDSMLALQVVARVHEELGIKLSLTEFFEVSTIGELAEFLDCKLSNSPFAPK